MKQKPSPPRNPFVAAAKFRKAGAHKKSNKALRRSDKMKHQGALTELSDIYLLSRTRLTDIPPTPSTAECK